MPNKPRMTLRSGKALADPAPILLQPQSPRRSQASTLGEEEEEEELLVRKKSRRSYQQTSPSSRGDYFNNDNDQEKNSSFIATTLSSGPTASKALTASRDTSSRPAQTAMTLTFAVSPPSSILQNQQLSSSFPPPTPRTPFSQTLTTTPIARIVAPAWQWKSVLPKKDAKGKGTEQPVVKRERHLVARFWRRPEVEAIVDWILLPGNYESLRVENARKNERMVKDVYENAARYARERVGWTKAGDEEKFDAAAARKRIDYIKKKFSATYSRVFSQPGYGPMDDAAVLQRLHLECPNFYELLAIFPTPQLRKPISTTAAHSMGSTATTAAGKAKIVHTEPAASVGRVNNPLFTPIYAAPEEYNRSSSNRPSMPIRRTQNFGSEVGTLNQGLDSFSTNGSGLTSLDFEFLINRIERLERKLDQTERKLEQRNDIICELRVKLASAGIFY